MLANLRQETMQACQCEYVNEWILPSSCPSLHLFLPLYVCWLSPQLTLACNSYDNILNILKACRQTCLGVWINHKACVQEAYCPFLFFVFISISLFVLVLLSLYLFSQFSFFSISLLTSDEFTASQETHLPSTVFS